MFFCAIPECQAYSKKSSGYFQPGCYGNLSTKAVPVLAEGGFSFYFKKFVVFISPWQSVATSFGQKFKQRLPQTLWPFLRGKLQMFCRLMAPNHIQILKINLAMNLIYENFFQKSTFRSRTQHPESFLYEDLQRNYVQKLNDVLQYGAFHKGLDFQCVSFI